MNPSEFTANATGRLLQNRQGAWTFVPNPLPPQLELDRGLILQLTEAYTTLGELAGVGQRLPNPHLLIGPFLRREAVLSSRIEGTVAGAQDLLLFEVQPEEELKAGDAREVANYIRALEHGLRRLAEIPVSLRLLKEMHALLMEGVRGGEKQPGEFRTRQNYIALPGQSIERARYVPPPVEEMHQTMQDLEKYIHRPEQWPFLIDLALLHYQFEAIHPFLDGNGRIGRLLISLLLCERKLLPQPLLYLSAYFERTRRDYYTLLLEISRAGAWMEWLRYFLTGVCEQSRDALHRARKLTELWQDYRRRVQAGRSPGPSLQLVDALSEQPALTVAQAQARLGVSFNTARASIARLVETGILREHTGRQRNRIFIAQEILALIEADSAG